MKTNDDLVASINQRLDEILVPMGFRREEKDEVKEWRLHNTWVRLRDWRRDVAYTVYWRRSRRLAVNVLAELRGDGDWMDFDVVAVPKRISGRDDVSDYLLPSKVGLLLGGAEGEANRIVQDLASTMKWFEETYATVEGYERRLSDPKRTGAREDVALNALKRVPRSST